MLFPFQQSLGFWFRESFNNILGLPKPALDQLIADLGADKLFLVDTGGITVWTLGTLLLGISVGILAARAEKKN
ncbi:MAG: hypothetical protein V3S97_03905 [Candidatus Bathyarchaeia archaeon]